MYEEFPVFNAGALAYADIFPVGLVPCRVERVEEPGAGPQVTRGRIIAKLTATRGPWKRGELVTLTAGDCIPRSYASVGRRRVFIQSRYRWA